MLWQRLDQFLLNANICYLPSFTHNIRQKKHIYWILLWKWTIRLTHLLVKIDENSTWLTNSYSKSWCYFLQKCLLQFISFQTDAYIILYTLYMITWYTFIVCSINLEFIHGKLFILILILQFNVSECHSRHWENELQNNVNTGYMCGIYSSVLNTHVIFIPNFKRT